MPRLSPLLIASLSLFACGGDDTAEEAGSAGSTSAASQDTGDADTGETGTSDPVCFPEGDYGPCSTNMGCQCVLGGDLYQACTRSCTESSECGDPADFPGATPTCSPVNPGEPDMICTLACTSTADCPCGLECQPTYLICTEPQ